MNAKHRLLAAVVDIQGYVRHDPNPDTCCACPRLDELQEAAIQAVNEIERLIIERDAAIRARGDA